MVHEPVRRVSGGSPFEIRNDSGRDRMPGWCAFIWDAGPSRALCNLEAFGKPDGTGCVVSRRVYIRYRTSMIGGGELDARYPEGQVRREDVDDRREDRLTNAGRAVVTTGMKDVGG